MPAGVAVVLAKFTKGPGPITLKDGGLNSESSIIVDLLPCRGLRELELEVVVMALAPIGNVTKMSRY